MARAPRDIPGVILAGGTGRRMGGVAKGLLPLAGRPVLDHVIARFAPQVGALALNANDPLPEDGSDHAYGDLPRLPDGVPDRPGPLAGVLAALHWAAEQGASHVATVPWDAPFLPLDLVARLAKGTNGPAGAAMAATWSGTDLHPEPVFALWPVVAIPALQQRLASGQQRVRDFAQHLNAVPVRFDPEGFFNINTPVDLARAEQLCHAL